MKKQIIIGILAIMLISAVTAGALSFSDKSSALTEISNKIIQRESELSNIQATNKKYIDKGDDCELIGLDSTESHCFATFSFTLDNKNQTASIVIPESSTKEDVDNLVNEYLKDIINRKYDNMKFTYNILDLDGQTIK